jgi:hypothetical protein
MQNRGNVSHFVYNHGFFILNAHDDGYDNDDDDGLVAGEGDQDDAPGTRFVMEMCGIATDCG